MFNIINKFILKGKRQRKSSEYWTRRFNRDVNKLRKTKEEMIKDGYDEFKIEI